MQPPTDGRGRDVLYRAEAVERAARVHDASYELRFELAEGRETYTGTAVLQFGLRSPDEPLFIDFTGHPQRLTVNGSHVELEHRDHRLWLSRGQLASHNRVELGFRNAFDGTGQGLHRFVDPEDGRTYLYTNFEPFAAHRLFPCFDQPDIKASYRLSVVAPHDWQVISAASPGRVSPVSGRLRLHDFPATRPFSSYLLPLVAGPYERVAGRHLDIELGLFGRRSMRRELERSADEILEITAQGLAYFEDLFGRRYPFGKYDQLFVPEFNAGAMENVGAVTFHDRFLFRDPPTYGQRLTRAEVILHELAHMWFGDLVTMRWWDDLWLNETFATYLSYRCLSDATRFRDAWQAFNGDMRPAAHRQDQLITTHPVATTVEHTDQAVGNFDAITYEKGAAVIKQLVATIGEESFRSGLQGYIERHAWGNATLADLLESLGAAAQQPLGEWARLWLQSASLNTIGVEWSSTDGHVVDMELRQTAPHEHPVLRPHATILGLVRQPAGNGELTVDTIPVRIDTGQQPVPAAIGRPAPLFVYPDHGDHDYALVRLDPVSLAFALERLPDLPDPLLRQQVWSTLWEMVRDATLPSTDLLAAVRRFTPDETDRALLQSILERAAEVVRRYVPDGRSAVEASLLAATAMAATRQTRDDLRLTWARAAIAVAGTSEDVEQLQVLVDGGWARHGFEPDQEMRWQSAIKAAAFGLGGADRRLAAELRRDPSDRGQRAHIRAQAARPEGSLKAETWERIHGPGYGSDYLTRAAILGFQWVHQRAVLAPFRASFYERVREVYASRDHAFATVYARGLVPDRWAEPAELERLRAFSSGLDEGQGLLRRHSDEIADDMARDIRVRAFAATAAGTASSKTAATAAAAAIG
ncbi:MAG TPA: aminopeptidase N [Candidatus Limnocylindrales bacterium]|nr:aminopeptidase N [Candidatus Limnocylindrales bacterium]